MIVSHKWWGNVSWGAQSDWRLITVELVAGEHGQVRLFFVQNVTNEHIGEIIGVGAGFTVGILASRGRAARM